MRFSAGVTLSAALLATQVAGLQHAAAGNAGQNRPARLVKRQATTPAAAPFTIPPTTLATLTTSWSSTSTSNSTSNSTWTSTSTSASTSASASASVLPTSVPGLTADQQQALTLHNAARSAVGCAPLVWDASLAVDAQGWADHLTTVGTLEHSSGTGQGENLAYQFGLSDPPYTKATKAWIDEKTVYNYEPIGTGDFAAYGHYTQCVWKTTTKVGMAAATSSDGKTYVVARYSPPGNFFGDRPY